MQLTNNFWLKEFNCNDGVEVPSTLIPTVQKLSNQLQVLRDYIGKPIYITSAYRHRTYNRMIGSNDRSQHVKAKAADIKVKGMSPEDVHVIIEMLIDRGDMLQGGLGLYDTFIHYDIRKTKARWDYRGR